MPGEKVEFGDGGIGSPLKSNDTDTTHPNNTTETYPEELLRVFDIYVEVYKGEPWFQDLSEDRDEFIQAWQENNTKIQTIQDENQKLIGFHLWEDGDWSHVREHQMEEFIEIVGYPVDGKNADLSNFDREKLQEQLDNELTNKNVYYILDLGTAESERDSMSTKVSLLKSIVDQLQTHDVVVAQTLNEGPLFNIIKDIKGLKIHEEITINDSTKRHILFTITTQDLQEGSRLIKLATKGSRLLGRIKGKLNPIINAGEL